MNCLNNYPLPLVIGPSGWTILENGIKRGILNPQFQKNCPLMVQLDGLRMIQRQGPKLDLLLMRKKITRKA